MDTKKSLELVIIGGGAAGASAAARARRLSETANITIIERGQDVSYASCGMPYYIGEEITDRSKLNIQTPESLKKKLNINVRTNTEAIKIDREKKVIKIYDHKSKKEEEIKYDKLLLTPGANPVKPPLKGIDDERIMTLRTLQDMDKIKEKADKSKKIAVIGAGFIGLEMVEMLSRLGKEVVLIELMPQVLPQLDPEMARFIEIELVENGVEVITGDGIAEFEPKEESILAKLNSGKVIECDMVVLSIGIKAETKLAEEAGLELGMRKTIKVNEYQQTSDPDIYAAGDAVETADPILDKRTSIPLAGPAHKQARVAMNHIFLGPEKTRPYRGTIGTSIVRVFDVCASVTGYTEKRLQKEGIPYRSVVVSAFNHAQFYPGATRTTVKVIWHKENKRILGGQVTGYEGVDKKIDIISTAIHGKLTIFDLGELELAYAPQCGSAKDVINIAGFAAQNIEDGLCDPTFKLEEGYQIIDVREPEEIKLDPIPNSLGIPYEEIRNKLSELDKSKKYLTVCGYGKLSYFSSRILKQNDFEVKSLVGGWKFHSQKPNPSLRVKKVIKKEEDNKMGSLKPIEIDACGLSCPGPIMKIKESLDKLQPGQEIIIKASDPGFVKDFPAYCDSVGLEVIDIKKDKGIITGKARKPGNVPQPQTTSQVPMTSKNGATIVVFSCDLDKVLASLVIANGALAVGGKVTLFFTFWGLNALRKEKGAKVKGKSFMDKMFGWMMPKGLNKLPLSKMHMGGLGTSMMKMRMKSKDLPTAPKLLEDAIKAGVRIVACSMSMEAMGIKLEELIDGVEVGGVADFINACKDTSINLFI